MELIADLVRRRIPCCSQAACCSAGARFEHCRATSTTGRHPITDVGILFAWARSCGACDTVSLMYPPWPCRHPPAPRPCPPVPPHQWRLVCGCVDWLRVHLVCGTKFALHTQNAPKRGISSEQGEFCTGSGTAGLVQGECCRRLRHRHQAPKHPAALRPPRPVHCRPPCRRNRSRMRIGYCDRDRLSASRQPIHIRTTYTHRLRCGPRALAAPSVVGVLQH